MKKDFLLEVLVQELPYKFIPGAIAQLKSSFTNLFKENALAYDDIKVYATPRRLAVLVSNLAVEQETVEKDVKGPILNIARDENGKYTPAGLGFAKKNNVEESALYEKDNYIWAHILVKGKTASEILADNIETLILKLQGSHFMRWGSHSEKFSRPIENVVALLGHEVVNLKIIDKKATNKTQGHRYSKNRELVIDEPKNYLETLKKGNVIASQEERRELIISSAKKCAQENNLEIHFDNMEELLEEVTFITEYPVAVLCNFDKKYLAIPSIVTTTVMTSHQRYFPLWDKEGRLSNYFITMANYVGDEFQNIQRGNQRVIAARLEDGIFFYEEDTKTKLIDKLDNLKGMTFQKGLGTLFDKTQRMIKLSDFIADSLKIQDKKDIIRTATLSKCDLSTKLVFEFTELQGFIGENYASLDKENSKVSKGICEHYFPLASNSELPSETEGQIVSIADKTDTICALFISTQKENKKKRPTGSNDPLGARRSAIGILRTIIEKNLNINLENIMKYSLSLLSEEFSIELEDTIQEELNDFFIQRLLFMYEKEFSSNVVNSLAKFNALRDLNAFIDRAKTLQKYQNDSNFEKIKENATRVVRILKDFSDKNVDEKLFNTSEEKALYEAIKAHNAKADNLDEYIKSLNSLIEPISNFFDKVLVMDKDELVKNNRLMLLNNLADKFRVICDFEKL
ncbi:MAG: glycine--tRNA ligase subunit beta [Candidatus Gastranaerophilales bacterium]|nr:glycine--tRNA ligase subunit beta [Candidatus Gastranaerophilales bacterium]